MFQNSLQISTKLILPTLLGHSEYKTIFIVMYRPYAKVGLYMTNKLQAVSLHTTKRNISLVLTLPLIWY